MLGERLKVDISGGIYIAARKNVIVSFKEGLVESAPDGHVIVIFQDLYTFFDVGMDKKRNATRVTLGIF